MKPQLNWAQWFAVSLPVCSISIALIWLLLLVSYRPAKFPGSDLDIEIRPIRPTREKFTPKQYFVTFICALTIILWCIESSIEGIVGDMGIIALLPIVAFFSTGVLRKVRFRSLPLPPLV